MNPADKSEAEIALDALLKVGAITDEQHTEAVTEVRERVAAQYAIQPDGRIRGI